MNSLPMGFTMAKFFILPLTTSMPLWSLAFVSWKFSLQCSPKNSFARQSAAVVFPVPAGPANSMFGMLPSFTQAFSLSTTCFWSTISLSLSGLYFSVQTCRDITRDRGG